MSARLAVLVVEDDDTLRTLLADRLNTWGYAVHQAASRQEALTRLTAAPEIMVVLLDLGLPPVPHAPDEGLATLRAVAAEMAPVKVVVLTGQGQEAAALSAIREGAFDFLGKPAGMDAILQAIGRACLFQRKERELAENGVARLTLNAELRMGLKAVRDEAEERLVRKVIRDTGFNVYLSAKLLGMRRETLYYFLNKFGIARDKQD